MITLSFGAGIQVTRKSLKRRSDSEAVVASMDFLVKKATDILDILKLFTGNSVAGEGRELHKKVHNVATNLGKVSESVWKRSLRAMAFEASWALI